MLNCKWLPDLIPCEDLSNWAEYENTLYALFKADFISSHPHFEGQQVNIRRYPIEYGKEEAFFHVTCQDYSKTGSRDPDLRRCERIRWVRSFIENYGCDSSACPECSGVKVWREPHKSNTRVLILLEEERYMVVVEPRKGYCLLITAFYFDQDHRLRRTLERYYRSLNK